MTDALGRFQKGEHWRAPAPHWARAWLVQRYTEEKRSAAEIAASVPCTEAAIMYWLRKHGIQRRDISQARRVKHWGSVGSANPMHGKFGPLNPRYVDGSSPERQRMFSRGEGKAFRRAVLERDHRRCRRCEAPDCSLHVHHVRSWAGNPALRFDMANVVTLCRSCHHWVHSLANILREFLA